MNTHEAQVRRRLAGRCKRCPRPREQGGRRQALRPGRRPGGYGGSGARLLESLPPTPARQGPPSLPARLGGYAAGARTCEDNGTKLVQQTGRELPSLQASWTTVHSIPDPRSFGSPLSGSSSPTNNFPQPCLPIGPPSRISDSQEPCGPSFLWCRSYSPIFLSSSASGLPIPLGLQAPSSFVPTLPPQGPSPTPQAPPQPAPKSTLGARPVDSFPGLMSLYISLSPGPESLQERHPSRLPPLQIPHPLPTSYRSLSPSLQEPLQAFSTTLNFQPCPSSQGFSILLCSQTFHPWVFPLGSSSPRGTCSWSVPIIARISSKLEPPQAHPPNPST